MKQIIDNKIYDTEKADKIYDFRRKVKGDECILWPGHYFYYWTNAQVYKTKKGNYFLHLDKAEGYDEKIETITEEKVKELIKELNPDKYLELFGSVDLEEA